MFSSQEIVSSLVSFERIFDALESALSKFKLYTLSLKILKCPEFDLLTDENIQNTTQLLMNSQFTLIVPLLYFLNIILKTYIRYGRSTSTESESDSYSNSYSKLRKTFVDSTVYVFRKILTVTRSPDINETKKS